MRHKGIGFWVIGHGEVPLFVVVVVVVVSFYCQFMNVLRFDGD